MTPLLRHAHSGVVDGGLADEAVLDEQPVVRKRARMEQVTETQAEFVIFVV